MQRHRRALWCSPWASATWRSVTRTWLASESLLPGMRVTPVGTPCWFAGFRVQADRGKARAGADECADVAHRPCLELQMLLGRTVVCAPAAGLGSLWDAPCERSLASCGRTQVAVVARPHTASIHVNPWPDPTTQDHPPEYLSPSHWQGLFWRWMGWLVGR